MTGASVATLCARARYGGKKGRSAQHRLEHECRGEFGIAARWGFGRRDPHAIVIVLVAYVQRVLNAGGSASPPLVVDGKWGPRTATAFKHSGARPHRELQRIIDRHQSPWGRA